MRWKRTYRPESTDCLSSAYRTLEAAWISEINSKSSCWTYASTLSWGTNRTGLTKFQTFGEEVIVSP